MQRGQPIASFCSPRQGPRSADMGLKSTADSPIFENGKLKPGIYKIQNLYTETYLDIHQHSKEVCCRPARDLEDGRGLVSTHLTFGIRTAEVRKWEIKPFGPGYTVQMVGFPVLIARYHTLSNANRSRLENLKGFVLLRRGSTAQPRFMSVLIRWLGE